jgi:hypothetical protein
MYANQKVILAETVQGMGEGSIKENIQIWYTVRIFVNMTVYPHPE